MSKKTDDLNKWVAKAVAQYWQTREQQGITQGTKSGQKDAGARAAVTGGAQMDGFMLLLSDLIQEAGVAPKYIFHKQSLQLPGFFRPTKEWDLLVVRDGQLILALEAKSQVGPSFGNNFNNRTEEAMGSALDLWTAFREGAFNKTVKPWLGYFFMLEDCPGSQRPVKNQEPHFKVFPEFNGASYAKRYELFCRKLMRERHYSATAFMTASKDGGLKGQYTEPAQDIRFEMFTKSLLAQCAAYGKGSL